MAKSIKARLASCRAAQASIEADSSFSSEAADRLLDLLWRQEVILMDLLYAAQMRALHARSVRRERKEAAAQARKAAGTTSFTVYVVNGVVQTSPERDDK